MKQTQIENIEPKNNHTKGYIEKRKFEIALKKQRKRIKNLERDEVMLEISS